MGYVTYQYSTRPWVLETRSPQYTTASYKFNQHGGIGRADYRDAPEHRSAMGQGSVQPLGHTFQMGGWYDTWRIHEGYV